MSDEEADLTEVLAFVDACEAEFRPVEHLEDDQELLEGVELVPSVYSSSGTPGSLNCTAISNWKSQCGEGGRRRKYKRPTDYNPNRARKEQLKELVALRDEVLELEQKVAALRSVTHKNSGFSSKKQRRQDSDDEDGREREKQVWRELMVRQIEQRTAAEGERKKLQREVEMQKKLIAELQQLAFCKAAEKGMDLVSRPSAMPHSLVHNFDSDVFRSMLEQVEVRYRGIDRVFEGDIEYYCDIIKTRCGNMREDASGHLSFQIFGRKVFPFDVEKVAGAAWERFGYSVRPNDSEFFFQDFTATEDSIAEVFGTVMQVEEKKAAVSASQVKRFYREKDRVSIVWQANVNTVSFMGRELSGATYQENGYFLIERPPLAPKGFAELRTCYVLTPTIPTRLLASDSLELSLVEFVSKWMAATIPANHQILEDRLVLESIGASQIPALQEFVRTPAYRSRLATQRLDTQAA